MTAQEIKNLRSRLKLTQPELAHKLDVAPMTVSRWERSVCSPHKVFIQQMKKMGVDNGAEL